MINLEDSVIAERMRRLVLLMVMGAVADQESRSTVLVNADVRLDQLVVRIVVRRRRVAGRRRDAGVVTRRPASIAVLTRDVLLLDAGRRKRHCRFLAAGLLWYQSDVS